MDVYLSSYSVLPNGARVVAAERSGISAWTKTAKISALLHDGSPKEYFFKVAFSQ